MNHLPTMKDIARAAGVSHGTVSNVINKTGKVSVKKIRLVEDAAKKLGYIPNTQAQLLRQGAVNRIAVIIPTLEDDRYRDLFMSIQSNARDFDVSVHCTDDVAGKEEGILAGLPQSNLAALISVSCLKEEGAAYDTFSCPVIGVNRSIDSGKGNAANISFDHYAAGTRIGAYILEQGWKRVAFFCSSGRLEDDSSVLSGINDALENTAVPVEKFSSDTKLIINRAFDIVNSEHFFDCIVAAGGLRANAVMSAAEFLPGPGRPKVLCIGASRTFPNPFIKTYEMDYGQMGKNIMDNLQNYLEKKISLPSGTILESRGFSFSFPNILKVKERQISMLALESPTTEALKMVLPQFRELTGLNLKITSFSFIDFLSHLNHLGDKIPYDLLRIDSARLADLGRSILLPLEEASITKDMQNWAPFDNYPENYYYSDNVLCALPFDPSVQVFFYRSDLFSDAVLRRLYYEKFHEPLNVPETIEAYLKTAEFFTRSFNPDSPTEYGTTITCGSPILAFCDFMPYFMALGGEICGKDGLVKIDTREMREAMALYKKMKGFTKCESNVWWSDSIRQFAEGLTATAHAFSNYATYVINSKISNVTGKTSVALMPGKNPLLGGGVLGICKYSKKLDASRQFLNWFYTRDVAQAIVRLGGSSPLKEAYNSYENFSIFSWLPVEKESFSIGKRGISQILSPDFSNYRFEEALGTALLKLLDYSMSPDEAASFAEKLYFSPKK